MGNYLSVEFKFPGVDDPVSRRDLIDQVVQAVSDASPRVFLGMLKKLPKDEAISADQSPIEKLFRVTFPSDNCFVVKLQAVIPTQHINNALKRSDLEDVETEKHWIMRSGRWVLSRVFSKDMMDEVDEQSRADRHDGVRKLTTIQWEALACSMIVEDMDKWFESNDMKPVVVFHGPSGSKVWDRFSSSSNNQDDHPDQHDKKSSVKRVTIEM